MEKLLNSEFLASQQVLLFYFQKIFRKYFRLIEVINSKEVYLHLRNASYIFNLHFILKHSFLTQLSQLLDLTFVDYTTTLSAYRGIYNLLNSKRNFRYYVLLYVGRSEQFVIPSIQKLYSSACWLEREAWDMFGIFFDQSIDLRRLLTDYGFSGHPLRKNFPITGYVQTRYDEILKRVVLEPVTLIQDFRLFNYNLVWEKIRK